MILFIQEHQVAMSIISLILTVFYCVYLVVRIKIELGE